jgi:hypothetical protein
LDRTHIIIIVINKKASGGILNNSQIRAKEEIENTVDKSSTSAFKLTRT